LYVGAAANRVGVLEIYLPYTPISEDVSAGIHTLYRSLAMSLALLYLIVFGISFWVGRRLRRQVRVNRFQAEHDALTGLPNRSYFRAIGDSELRAGAQRGRSTTIAVIDLDRFKEVNDTLGHQNGDRLLTTLAERIALEVRLPHTVARFGGDEFGIILSGVDAPYDALCQLREVIQSEVLVSGLPLSVEASIGYAVAPMDGTSIDDLLQLADMAMYVAKNVRSGVAGYDVSQNHYDASQLTLVAELRHAIASDQLVLHYQPKIDLHDHRVGGVEALVRWQHPQQGLLFPDRFIPLVEQTDLIDELSLWVIGQALNDLHECSSDDSDFHMAVNVSVRNLGRIGFAAQVLDALRDAHVEPQRLTIEVTETALMADPTRTADALTQMSDAGVRISIDDFGSGQTSLGMLANLPIAELKIDRTFIQDVQSIPEHAAIVRSMVELGHQLGLGVVAEGVETQMELTVVASTGCDVVQGYHFARPMPLDQLKPWLATASSVTF
jgi:diguanylate cyclase (GGDEF)-like protein